MPYHKFMNKTYKIALLVGVVVVMVFVGLAWGLNQKGEGTHGDTPTPTATAIPEPTETTRVYGNEFFRISLLSGWDVEPAGGAPNTGAVSIRKDKYILYVNPRAQQASGVEGGRFSEIAMGAPSADAVITEHPVPPCADPVNGGVFGDWQRKDLYVDSATTASWCNKPVPGKQVWYFSYITTETGGIF